MRVTAGKIMFCGSVVLALAVCDVFGHSTHEHHYHEHAHEDQMQVHVAHVSRRSRRNVEDQARMAGPNMTLDDDGEMTREGHDCATHIPEPEEIDHVESELRVFRSARLAAPDRRRQNREYLKIKLVFHCIHNNGKGKPTLAQIRNQVDVMNEAYSGATDNKGIDSRMRFELKSHRFIDSAMYSNDCRGLSSSLRAEHAYADPEIVNVFTCNADGYLGWAYLPWQYTEGSKYQVILIHPETMPGGSFNGLNLGDTLVHEMGHYLGLLHTFSSSSGSCTAANDDKVDDTPLEATPNYGCDASRDTCKNAPGNDPVWSFMDYSKDTCMNRFSQGQIDRMRDMIQKFRPKLESASLTDSTYGANAPPPTPQPTRRPTNRSPTRPPPTTPPPTPRPTKQPTTVMPTTAEPTPWPTKSPSMAPSYAEYCSIKFTPTQLSNIDRFDVIVQYATNARNAQLIVSLKRNEMWYGGTQALITRGEGTILMSGIAVQGLEAVDMHLNGFNIEALIMPRTAFSALDNNVLSEDSVDGIEVVLQYKPPTQYTYTAKPTSPPPTSPPPTDPYTPPPPTYGGATSCTDMIPNWVDKDGDGCDVYRERLWCTSSGDYGERWGTSGDTFETYSANGGHAAQVCCACGGGIEVHGGGGSNNNDTSNNYPPCPEKVKDYYKTPVLNSGLKKLSTVRIGKAFDATIFECRTACMEQSICKSFVYNSASSKCAICNANAEGQGLIASTKWTYYERMVFECNSGGSQSYTTDPPNTPGTTLCAYCLDEYNPVCSITTGVQYNNPCLAVCNQDQNFIDGPCMTTTAPDTTPAIGPDPHCPYCMREYVPVCSNSGVQFYNPCFAMCHNAGSFQFGMCPPDSSQCPYCIGEYVPVCGQGQSFYNPCFAHCRGVHVFRDGNCDEYLATTTPIPTTTSTPSPSTSPTTSPTIATTTPTTTTTTDYHVDCHCAPIDLPVCANGIDYSNPCHAFCARNYGFEYGTCEELGGQPTPPSGGVPDGCVDLGADNYYTEGKNARLTRTNRYTIGDRYRDIDTPEECARLCDGYSHCVAFEYAAKKKFCDLKETNSIVTGTNENNVWVLYELSDACDSGIYREQVRVFEKVA